MGLDLEIPMSPKNPNLSVALLPSKSAHGSTFSPPGLNVPVICGLCNNGDESLVHVLRDCTTAQRTWNNIGIPISKKSTFGLPVAEWIKVNCQAYENHLVAPWTYVFPQVLWLLWKQRNQWAFEGKKPNVQLQVLCSEKAKEYFAMVWKDITTPKVQIMTGWSPPPLGWFKLNTDGAVMGNLGKGGGGGVLRDERGRWLKGFCMGLGTTNSLAAEGRGLREGLRLAVSLGIQFLSIELDARVLYDLFYRSSRINMYLYHIILECRNLCWEFQDYKATHVYDREGNTMEDFMAHYAQEYVPPGLRSFWEHPITGMQDNVFADVCGMLFPIYVRAEGQSM